MLLPLLLLGPIVILLLAVSAAAVRYAWSSRKLRLLLQSHRNNVLSTDSASAPSALPHPPLRRSLSEVISDEQQAEQRADASQLPSTATPLKQRSRLAADRPSHTSVVVHSPVSAASPSLPHPPPSPFLWTRPPAFSPQYTSTFSIAGAAPSPASRRSLPPLPSSAATSAGLRLPASPAVPAAAPSRKRGASPHIISLSDAIGLSQPDKRSRRARGRDARNDDDDDIEMADSGTRGRAQRKETRRNREARERDEDGMVDSDEEAADATTATSSKRRNVLPSPAATRRQTISENELRRRKRAGRALEETTKRARKTKAADDAHAAEEEREGEVDEDEDNDADGTHAAESLTVNIDDSAEADDTTGANGSSQAFARPPPTPSHLLPLAPPSPFFPTASSALLDPKSRRKSGRMPYRSRHSLPAPSVLNSSWVRDGEELTEEEKEREDKVTQMLEQGLNKGRRRLGKDRPAPDSRQQEEHKADAGAIDSINGANLTASAAGTAFPQSGSTSTAGATPTFPFSGTAALFTAAAPSSSSSSVAAFQQFAADVGSSSAPFNFTVPSQQQPAASQSAQFTSAAAPFSFSSSSASSPPSATASPFPGFSGGGIFGGSSGPSQPQPQFGALPTSQPLQSQSSGAADSGGSAFRAPARSARGGKGRAGGRR